MDSNVVMTVSFPQRHGQLRANLPQSTGNDYFFHKILHLLSIILSDAFDNYIKSIEKVQFSVNSARLYPIVSRLVPDPAGCPLDSE